MTIAKKMTHHIKLSDNNLRNMVYGDYYDEGIKFIESVEGDEHRWYREMTLIFYNYEDEKYYSIYYYRGLTEIQDNEFYEQVAQEVEQVSKFIEVKEWVPVAGDK